MNWFKKSQYNIDHIDTTMFGVCMLAAEEITKQLLDNGIKDFKVVEGWIDFGEQIGNESENDNLDSHTWIEYNGKIIDPTKEQFKRWGHDPEKIRYVMREKVYTPENYLKTCDKYPIINPEQYYKKAQINSIDVSQIISKPEFERRIQMLYNQNREAYKEYGFNTYFDLIKDSQNDMLNNNLDNNELALTLNSDHQFYQDYIQKYNGEISSYDVLEAYLNGNLKNNITNSYNYNNIEFSQPIKQIQNETLWSPKKQKELTVDEAKNIYQIAISRRTKSNQNEIDLARKKLFLAFNSDNNLAKKIGISDTELNTKIKTYTGFKKGTQTLHQNLNYNVPEEHQWHGLINSSFINKNTISLDDLDQFVKNIDLSSPSGKFFYGNKGEGMRRYILNTFLSINTRLDYKDLSFKTGKFDKHTVMGEFSPAKNVITISDISQNTIAHEIGHYIDYKFGKELYNKSNIYSPLSRMSHSEIERYGAIKKLDKNTILWYKKTKSFMDNLRSKGDIESEYTQDPSETFARFVDSFVQWTTQQATGQNFSGIMSKRDDKFTEKDYKIFIRILQELSYVKNI